MQIKDIKRGLWYATVQGIGECLQTGGTHPPSVQFRITSPLPRGIVYLKGRDVLRPLTETETAIASGKSSSEEE